MELKLVKPGKYANQVLAAQNVRKELRHHFPGCKFSVTSKSYSGGDSIRVDWIDGPTEVEVGKFTAKYEAGKFDGMIDLYTHNPSKFNNLHGGTKYLFLQRDYSIEQEVKMLDKICLDRGVKVKATVCDGWLQVENVMIDDVWASQYLRRELYKTSFYEVNK